MPDTAEFPYRLAIGWVSVATLEGSDTYLLTNFAVQTDQGSRLLFPWGPPDDTLTTFPSFQRYGQFTTTEQWADGGRKFDWGLKFLTENMTNYWENSLIFGSIDIQTKAVTVKTRWNDGIFRVTQGYANRAQPGLHYKRGVRGLLDYIQPFSGMRVIT